MENLIYFSWGFDAFCPVGLIGRIMRLGFCSFCKGGCGVLGWNEKRNFVMKSCGNFSDAKTFAVDFQMKRFEEHLQFAVSDMFLFKGNGN